MPAGITGRPEKIESSTNYRLEIVDIVLKKASGEGIGLLDLFAGINIYQSIFQPMMKAELMLYDSVSLHSNFPLIGEEIIELTINTSQVNNDPSTRPASLLDGGEETQLLTFCIDTINYQSVSEDGRSSLYVMSLYSSEVLESVKKRVQSGFNTTYTDAIRLILDNELNMTLNNKRLTGMTENGLPEQTKGSFKFIVPNLKPIDALLWVNKRSVSTDPDNFYFVLFERFDGFYFNTIQQMIKYQKKVTEESKTPEDAPFKIKKYYYFPYFNDNIADSLNPKPANLQQRLITNLIVNKRYSTFQKIVAGFFENEYYEIDIYNKQIHSTTTQVDPLKAKFALEERVFNTEQFTQQLLTKDSSKGTKTKIKYAIVQDRGDYPGAPHYFYEKYGEGIRTQAAMAQISITATAIGDTRVQAGDVIDLNIPEAQGFDTNSEDKYLKGKYLVTDIKHQLVASGAYSIVMNLNRDSFFTDIDNVQQYKEAPPDTIKTKVTRE